MYDAVFPPDFLWGAGTSAYQIEGAIYEGGRGLSIWDQFAMTPGKTYQGQTGAIAIDHYHSMAADVALMAELGLQSYRFSIAWPRVIPDGSGPVNQRGLDFYERLVDTLLAHGITPMATLYHWDLPIALHQLGGWLRRDTAGNFADYAAAVAHRLGDRVDWWLTINEPWCAAYQGYGDGKQAPGSTDLAEAVIAGHHLLVAHGLGMQAVRAYVRPHARLGLALNLYPVDPVDEREETLRAASMADHFKNRWFLDPIFRGQYPEHLFASWGVEPPPMHVGDAALISQPIDYLGINYYERSVVRAAPTTMGFEEVRGLADATYTDMAWEVYPLGLTRILTRVHRDYAPSLLIVTENGAAYHDVRDTDGTVHDPGRLNYVQRHVEAVGDAIRAGAPVGGYFVWSLFDNFEWAEGYRYRFGLVYVDYQNQQRIIKTSARWFGDFMRAQRLQHREGLVIQQE